MGILVYNCHYQKPQNWLFNSVGMDAERCTAVGCYFSCLFFNFVLALHNVCSLIIIEKINSGQSTLYTVLKFADRGKTPIQVSVSVFGTL